jgi:ABC-type protease/lipase transport system fused ATPase/permease subunit
MMKKTLYTLIYIIEAILLIIAFIGASIVFFADAMAQLLPDKSWYKSSQSNTHFSFFHKGDIKQSNKE